MSKLLDQGVSVLGLSQRTEMCLRRADIRTVKELLSKSTHEMLGLRHFSFGCLQEVQRKLATHGLSFSE